MESNTWTHKNRNTKHGGHIWIRTPTGLEWQSGGESLHHSSSCSGKACSHRLCAPCRSDSGIACLSLRSLSGPLQNHTPDIWGWIGTAWPGTPPQKCDQTEQRKNKNNAYWIPRKISLNVKCTLFFFEREKFILLFSKLQNIYFLNKYCSF